MHKKLLAVAVVSALGAPVLVQAQTSTVQIYGRFYMEYSYVDQGQRAAAFAGPSIGSANNIDVLQQPGSNIGFKGEEKLGGGLSAWFQCESSADFRGVNQEGWCGRNSALGMKGGFGNVFIGRWDTPVKRIYGPLNVGANISGIWGNGSVVGGGAGSQIGPATRAVMLSRRQSNMINYDSPVFGGFQLMTGFSTAQTPGTASTSGATNSKSRLLSIGAKYSAGPLFVGAGYSRHKDFGGGGAPAVTGGDTSDDVWIIGAAYTWGPVRVGGFYTRQELEPTTTTKSKIDAWKLGVDWKIVGPHGLRASYSKVDDVEGSSTVAIAGSGGVFRPAAIVAGAPSNSGADLMTIRYVYTFSKRTEFNLGYAKLDNDPNAAYRLRSDATGLVAGGNNEDAWGISLSHRF